MENRIKTLREKRGISQKELAKMLHLAQSSISGYESGKKQPSPETMARIADIRGTKIEVPVLLALWLCMSRSEILGLTWDDVDFTAHTLRVEKSRVVDVDGKTVIKPTKNRYRTRTLTLPEYIEKVLAKEKETATSEFICPMHPNTISKEFKKFCEKNGIRPLRFHDLRHSSASVMIALNIPFFYAQRRGGWASDNMLQKVYGHQLEAKRNEFDDRIDEFFDALNDENDEKPV